MDRETQNKSSLILTPNAYKEGTLFNYKPLGTDFTFQRNSVADRINEQGDVQTMGVNFPLIDYDEGNCPSILIKSENITRAADYITLNDAQDLIGQEEGSIYIKFNAGDNFEINMLNFLKTVSGETEYILTYSTNEVRHYVNGVLEQTNTGNYDWSDMNYIDLGNTNGQDFLDGRVIIFCVLKEIIEL